MNTVKLVKYFMNILITVVILIIFVTINLIVQLKIIYKLI